MLKRIDKETFWGGLFGIIAIIATAGEMILSGISKVTILSAIKDIAGTLVGVMVFFIAVKHLIVRKAKDFDGVFELEMEKIIKKYNPIIIKDLEAKGRYNIASNLDSILGREIGIYHTMFEINNRSSVVFNVTKTLFMGKSKDSFDDLQKAISTQIGAKLKETYSIIEKYETTSKGIRIVFEHELRSVEDAILLARIVDYAILLYFVEYKK